MTESKGLFIVVECIDEALSISQLRKLETYLQNAGFEVESYNFPLNTPASGTFVGNYAKGKYGDIKVASPYKASLFYALNHFEAAQDIIRAVNEGKVVLATNYSGAHMASEGTKFSHPEERRGYFIWNDNLEFEVLGIPRPTKNFVLITDDTKKQQTTATFEDLCQLFPRDFQKIDCVRNGQLLPTDTISEMLWKRVEAFVPSSPQPEPTQQARHDEPAIPNSDTITLRIPQISHLLLPVFAKHHYALSQKDSKPTYYTPASLDTQTIERYNRGLRKIYKDREHVFKALVQYLHVHGSGTGPDQLKQQARDYCAALLPLATAYSLELEVPASAISELAVDLSKTGMSEANTVVGKVFRHIDQKTLRQSLESIFSGNSQALKRERAVDKFLRDQATSGLPNTYGQHENSVRLIQKVPKNEFDLIPELLYMSSNLSQQEIQTGFEKWSYDKKEQTLTELTQKYLDLEGQRLQPLEAIGYEFDVVCDFTTYLRLNALIGGRTVRQDLTPSYGYAVPSIIDEAGVADEFESCFDTSLELYSILQAAGSGSEAQYAALCGHRLRFKAQLSLHDIKGFSQPASKDQALQLILDEMMAEIAEVHPLLASSLFDTNKISG